MHMADETEKRLAEILQSLPAAQAEALLEFAEFLLMRHGAVGDKVRVSATAAEIPAPE